VSNGKQTLQAKLRRQVVNSLVQEAKCGCHHECVSHQQADRPDIPVPRSEYPTRQVQALSGNTITTHRYASLVETAAKTSVS